MRLTANLEIQKFYKVKIPLLLLPVHLLRNKIWSRVDKTNSIATFQKFTPSYCHLLRNVKDKKPGLTKNLL